MDGLRSIVALSRDSLRGVKPADVGPVLPRFEWVEPTSLFVEERYQREVAENGVALVRRIYAGFDWSKFKPPVCVEIAEWDGVLVCIDGQHTAIGAACHPDVQKIPVMIVDAATAERRASAFVGHNRDRLVMTAPIVYRAELAAGDPLAVLVGEACRAAGATVLDKNINLRRQLPVGTTIAIGAMKGIAKREGKAALERVMRALVAAGRGPIKADEVSAAGRIFREMPALDDARLVAVIASKTTEQWAAIGATAAAETRQKLPDAVCAAWCRALNVRLGVPAAPRKPVSPPRPHVPPAPRSIPEPAPKPAPEIRKPPPARQTAPRPPFADPEAADKTIRVNGMVIDLAARTLQHRGTTVRVHRDDGVRLVVALSRVAPALLDPSVLIRKAFVTPRADGAEQLRNLIADVNPVLRAARLEIRTFKVGSMIADLGAEQRG